MNKWSFVLFFLTVVVTSVIVFGIREFKKAHESEIRCDVVARCYEKRSFEECWDLEQRLCRGFNRGG